MSLTARTWIAFFVAPGAPGALLYVFGLANGYGDASIVGPLLLVPFAYLAAIAIGGPVHVVLCRRAVRDLATYVMLGAGIGLLVVLLLFGTEVIFYWWSAREHAVAVLRNSVGSALLAVGYAATSSALFWFIAVRGARAGARGPGLDSAPTDRNQR